MNSQDNMQVDVQFRHMPKSNAIKYFARFEAAELERCISPGSHCEVVVDETQHRHLNRVFAVRIRLVVPGDRCYVAHRKVLNGSREFICGAMNEAFDDIRQQLRKRNRIQLRRQRREMAA